MIQTDEAIQDVRDFCGKAWTEYREQAPMHEIMRMSTLLPILLAHIDDQAGKIATLKAALICEREESVELFWHPGVDFGELPAKRTSEAKAQLAQEYPGIKWEE